jgi:hypothetical protein
MKAIAPPEGRGQRGSEVTLGNVRCPDFCSGASTENVTYPVHPCSRLLALNS